MARLTEAVCSNPACGKTFMANDARRFGVAPARRFCSNPCRLKVIRMPQINFGRLDRPEGERVS